MIHLSRTVLDQMKKWIIESKRVKREYSALLLNGMGRHEVGSEYSGPGILGNKPIFHTHVHFQPEASTLDMILMAGENRPYSCVGSISRHSRKPTINCYKVSTAKPWYLPILKRIAAEMPSRFDPTEFTNKLQRRNIKVPLDITTYQFYDRKWNVSHAVEWFNLGYVAPGGGRL